MNGKQKCKILKQIRQQIAEANDIELIVSECTHKGECRGTCPRCEAEVRYLERELEKRRQLMKRVALAGVSAGVTLALSGCSAVEEIIDALPTLPKPTSEVVELSGDVPYQPEPTEEVFVTDGEVSPYDYPDAGEEG